MPNGTGAQNAPDPLGKNVEVYFWSSDIGEKSVGHVLLKEANSAKVLLSQFPHEGANPLDAWGLNRTLSLPETVSRERGPPDMVFQVTIHNVAAFNATVKDHAERTWWSPLPISSDATHCARAVAAALQAGGVYVSREYPFNYEPNEILPGTLANVLARESSQPHSGVKKIMSLNRQE